MAFDSRNFLGVTRKIMMKRCFFNVSNPKRQLLDTESTFLNGKTLVFRKNVVYFVVVRLSSQTRCDFKLFVKTNAHKFEPKNCLKKTVKFVQRALKAFDCFNRHFIV